MWHFRVKYIFICPCPPSSLFHHHRLYVLSLCVLLPFYLFCGSSISSLLVNRDLNAEVGVLLLYLHIVCVRRVLQAGPGGRLHACSSGPGGLLRSCALAHFFRRACTFLCFPFPSFEHMHLHFVPPFTGTCICILSHLYLLTYLSYFIGVPLI